MKMKVKMRQVFGIIFSLVLVLGLMPGMSLTVRADASVPYQVAQVNATTHAVTFSSAQCSSYTSVTDSSEAVTWNSGWYVVPEGNVTVNARITVNGEVNLILSDGAYFNPKAGITVAENNTLNIYAQSKGNHMGKIYVSGGDQYAGTANPSNDSAGIGGGREQSGGTVTIHGGMITATGGPGGAGIGGGWKGNGGVLTVYGGNITATGGQNAAGIGGGSGYYQGNHVNANGGEVKIYGGTVTATGGYESMGIGMGYYGSENGSLTLGEGVQLYGGNSQNAQSEVTLSNNDYARYRYMKTVAETTTDVSGVELNKTSTALTVGKTETLTATVSPDDATDKTITWSSDNTAVATVSNGVVTAVAEGTATITVTATNGTDDTSDDKTATCAVKVNAASSGGGSSDSGSGSSSSSGTSDSGNTSGGTSSGTSDNTNTNTDTSAKVPYDDVAISTGSVNDITGTAAATAESNPFGTKIENNNNLTTLLSLTDAEVAQGVNVWLDIQDMSASVPQTDKTLIQDKSGDYTVGLYLDINLFKKVGSNDATKVTETNGKVKASIVIPESLWKSGRTFEIIRVHDGVATAIAGTYDENTHVFTFETDKFSTYALAYKDPASSSDSGTTSNSSNSTQATAPKTGDSNDIRVWYLLLIASLGGLGFLGYSKKKKVND